MKFQGTRTACMLLAAAALAGGLSACVPLVVGGAAVGTMVAVDRRTSGTQLEDESIEMRSANRIYEILGDRAHVNVTSWNRQVLLTGEVPTADDRQKVEQAVLGVENVRSIVNELVVAPNSSVTQRSNDALITGKVKASFVDAKDIMSSAFKVVTERGVVYLMGRVTQREATRATEITRGVSGVAKVVRVFEIISEDEMRRGFAAQQPAPVVQDPAHTAP
ncbi:BON domain-containing protein [Paenacidovorax monticola]|uniref:BON domain-containing protein n=1 Tax=Paenacidovorax monticola TaxID=1926868 RepID=A0A7H0HC91_9BURK|nr:BON domain-containing protein [Paenacidovorax monticola]QNP58157.1 BON domain-containing protein [Paenacidovorax monticola]